MHPFFMAKRQFGYTKVRYRGLAKNTAQVLTLFALSNLRMARDVCCSRRGNSVWWTGKPVESRQKWRILINLRSVERATLKSRYQSALIRPPLAMPVGGAIQLDHDLNPS